jgi:hypothetical protein
MDGPEERKTEGAPLYVFLGDLAVTAGRPFFVYDAKLWCIRCDAFFRLTGR